MALPKRRHSRARGRKRRTHWTITPLNVIECSHCHEFRLPHHICPACGYYDGRQVLSKKEEA
ncbi:MAG: 50S ribosomal protein L32 [candidate division Zixibacteria bacterium]|nr:50S ribosomal protein L32 [candidate division Zixibacteria bacterium]MCK4606660.1 50S ribosomal protein L32 [candidate division Zixibacteria bacterium]